MKSGKMPTWLIVLIAVCATIFVGIAAISILAAIALIAINPKAKIEEAKQTKIKYDLNAVQQSLEMYKVENGTYPATLDSLVPDFLPAIPTHPDTDAQYTYSREGADFLVCANTTTCVSSNETLPSATTGKSCIYKGETYVDGQGFKDECNSCSCSDGKVQCTTIACE